MKNSLLISIVAGAAAGVASAFATSLVLLEPTPAVSETIAVAPAEATRDASGPDAEWKRDLERLRADNLMLSDRLRSLESQPAAAVEREPVEPTPDPAVARLEDQLRQLLAAMTNADAPLPEALATNVREVYSTIQEEERQEREARYAEVRDAEMTARMERYATELGLDAYQTTEMRAILTRERDKREELLTVAREAGSFLDLRDQMADVRSATNTELEHVLTEEQLEKYESLDRGRFGFGFGGGPGGAPPAFGGWREGGNQPGGGRN